MTDERQKPGPDPKRPAELMAWLRQHAQPTTIDAVTLPSITELVRRTGIPRRSLELAIRRLEANGALVVRRGNPRTGPVRLEVV